MAFLVLIGVALGSTGCYWFFVRDLSQVNERLESIQQQVVLAVPAPDVKPAVGPLTKRASWQPCRGCALGTVASTKERQSRRRILTEERDRLTEAVGFMQETMEQLPGELLPLGFWRKFPVLPKHRDEFQILSSRWVHHP